MHDVVVERAAERDLKRLEGDVFRRVIRAIRSLRDDPRPPGSRKLGGWDGGWRIRVGDYRILYEILDQSVRSGAVALVLSGAGG